MSPTRLMVAPPYIPRWFLFFNEGRNCDWSEVAYSNLDGTIDVSIDSKVEIPDVAHSFTVFLNRHKNVPMKFSHKFMLPNLGTWTLRSEDGKIKACEAQQSSSCPKEVKLAIGWRSFCL